MGFFASQISAHNNKENKKRKKMNKYHKETYRIPNWA